MRPVEKVEAIRYTNNIKVLALKNAGPMDWGKICITVNTVFSHI